MRRALLRSGVPLYYTEGFNPHPYLSVAAPLSVGCSGVCGLLDAGTVGEVSTDGLCEAITAMLPVGLEVTEAYIPARKFDAITWIELSGELYYEMEPPPDIAERLYSLFEKTSIIITKKTKRGSSEFDIAPYIRDAVIFSKELRFSLKVSAKDPTVTPEHILSALNAGSCAPDAVFFTRLEQYDADMNAFR
jgi:radical SAM-linked protein